jgi:6-phosphofructokinase 1
MVHGIEGVLGDNLIDLSYESAAQLERLSRTPAAALGSCRHKLTEDDYGRILDTLRAYNVRHFAYIGGNDSMDTCHRIGQLASANGWALQVVGVPKTIDNDLAFTDHCPGFGSAARFLALATRDTGRDLEAMATFDDVTILEAMGRNAGWLTAASTLGKETEDEAPHLVYVPEIPFDTARFVHEVAGVHRRLGRVFVVVSEGIRDAEGMFIGGQQADTGDSDTFGHVVHSLTTGVAAYLTDVVRKELGLQARFLRPGLIGRAMSACVSKTDREEALLVGKEAVSLLAAGGTGQMITLERTPTGSYGCQAGTVPLVDVANAEKLLLREYLNTAGTGVTPAFFDYALPLIGGALPPQARLEGRRVAAIARQDVP